ncbi:MAG: hypothetical protein ACOH5I_06595 [Oligoflexus sp.]
MKRNSSCRQTMTAALLASSLLSGQLQAIPLPSEDFKLDRGIANAVANHSKLKYAAITKDHESNVLYVSPAGQKVQGGQFEQTSALECSRYRQLYELTYTLPSSNAQALEMALAGESTGPYFDLLYFHYAFFHDFIIEAYASSKKILQWRDEHGQELAEIATLEAEISFVEAQIEPLQSKVQSLQSELNVAMLALIQTTPGTPAHDSATRNFQEVQARVSPKIEEHQATISTHQANLLEKKLQRDIKQANLDVTKPLGFDEAARLAGEARRAMSDLNDDANKAHKTLVSALNVVDQKTVGYANAWFTVWDDEQAALQAILSNHGSRYNAQRLPIFNAKFKKNTPKESEQIMERSPQNDPVIGADTEYGQFNTAGLDLSASALRFPAMAFGTMPHRQTGASVKIGKPEKDLGSAAEQGFRSLVTQGLYCSGEGERQRTQMVWNTKDGYRVSFPRVLLPSSRSTNVIAQPVKLSYEYYQKTDPIAVSCQLTIDKFERFARDAGNTRFLFWGKKWDKARMTQINNNGLSCHKEINPQAGAVAVDEKKAEEIYQSLMQDMAADYILNFASSYAVAATQPTGNILPDSDWYSGKVGPAMRALCQGNIYCQITDVVFVALENLIQVNSGKVDHVDSKFGTISRNYSERSYTKVDGESIIKVEVRL